MTVNLDPTFGRVEVSYLTGEGRAAGDTYLEITRQTINDGATILQRDGIDPINLRLNGFQTLTARINVPFGVTTSGRPNSRNFSEFLFDPNRVLVENASGVLTDTGTDLNAAGLPVSLDARIRAFPGRSTVVQLFVSTASFSFQDADNDPTTPDTFVFDETRFKEQNYSISGTDPDAENRLASRLSDFVRFPLANIPVGDRPDLKNGYEEGDVITNGAQFVYFSGDNYALSNAVNGAGSIFQEVGPVFTDVVLGKWSEGSGSSFPATYDLRDSNPPEFPNTTRLVSVYGEIRNFNQVLTGGSTFEVIMFPNSGETYTFEGDPSSELRGRLGDVVAMVRNGSGQITNLYFGSVDLGKGEIELFPIKGLGADPADPDIQAARISGTISGYLDANGAGTANHAAVRRFSFDFAAGSTLPTGFTDTGTVTVFRR